MSEPTVVYEVEVVPDVTLAETLGHLRAALQGVEQLAAERDGLRAGLLTVTALRSELEGQLSRQVLLLLKIKRWCARARTVRPGSELERYQAALLKVENAVDELLSVEVEHEAVG